ncbi:hypothetical protein F5Y04DRAFT_247564 [Hypomontagnella monticulosa]|nr:hypothetical protein F5Y04DRAFT_247564 [Hypomontagnella monticulosa]
MSGPPFSLPVPMDLQRFTCYRSLPYEVRLKIWEEIIYTPGIHFLKFGPNDKADTNSTSGSESGSGTVTATGNNDSTTDRQSQPQAERKAKKAKFSSTLQPIFSLPAADKSYYLTMNKTLTQLSLTCREAKDLINRLSSYKGNLTLDDGRLVLLEKSCDIVCFDYPGITRSRRLGYWASRLDLDQLSHVRRVALRYCSKWDEECAVCRTCGIIHDFDHSANHTRPRHAYEFASMFKNLETFYFIDYMAVRRPSDQINKAWKNQAQRYASGEAGRSYFEVSPHYFKVNPQVYHTAIWARDNYVAHCKKYSIGPANPEKVKFRILASEWDDGELVPAKRQERPRVRVSSLIDDMKNLSLGKIPAPDTKLYSGILPVTFGDRGKSQFEFTFKMPFPAPR